MNMLNVAWIIITYIFIGIFLFYLYPKEALWIIEIKSYYGLQRRSHQLRKNFLSWVIYIFIAPWEILESFVLPLEYSRRYIQRIFFIPSIDKLRERRDIPKLVKALRRARANDDDLQEFRVVRALAEVADVRAMKQLFESLYTDNYTSSLNVQIQEYSALALGLIAKENEEAIEVLLDRYDPYRNPNRASYEYFKDKKVDTLLERACIDAFAIAGSPQVFPYLISALESRDVALNAHQGLVKLGENSLPYILQELEKKNSKDELIHLLEVLRNIGIPSPEVIEIIVKILENACLEPLWNIDVLGMATLTLERIGNQSALSSLKKASEMYRDAKFTIYPIDQNKLYAYKNKTYGEIVEGAIHAIDRRNPDKSDIHN